MQTQTKYISRINAARKYAAIVIAAGALTFASPAHASNSNSCELPVYRSTIEYVSNSQSQAKTEQESKLAERERKIAQEKQLRRAQQMKEYSQACSDYTNYLTEARNTFNEGLKDGTFSVTEQSSVIEKYEDALNAGKLAQENPMNTNSVRYQNFLLPEKDNTLYTNLVQNVENHDTNAVANLENSLNSNGLPAKVEVAHRHHGGGFFFFPFWYWYFFLRRRHD